MEKFVNPPLLSPKIRKQYDQITYKFPSIIHHIIYYYRQQKNSAKLKSLLQESRKLVLHRDIKMCLRYEL